MSRLVLIAALVGQSFVLRDFPDKVQKRDVPSSEWRRAAVEHLEKCHPEPRVIAQFPEARSASQQLRARADEIDACDAATFRLRELVEASGEPR